MLRKFHASQLYNDGLSMDEIDELQGRGKDQTRTSYFMEDPLRLREKYIEHMVQSQSILMLKNYPSNLRSFRQWRVKIRN